MQVAERQKNGCVSLATAEVVAADINERIGANDVSNPFVSSYALKTVGLTLSALLLRLNSGEAFTVSDVANDARVNPELAAHVVTSVATLAPSGKATEFADYVDVLSKSGSPSPQGATSTTAATTEGDQGSTSLMPGLLNRFSPRVVGVAVGMAAVVALATLGVRHLNQREAA